MAFSFLDLKQEVKRRATRNQGGTVFDTAITNVINTSMWRVAREARWRTLRRSTTFDTVIGYDTGTGAVTLNTNSRSFSVSGANFMTEGIKVGRYVKFGGSNKYFKISTVLNGTSGTVNMVYDGTNSGGTGTYSILGQEEYVLPIQVGHSAFLWHRAYGYPLLMDYVPSMEFYRSGAMDTIENVPVAYQMWGMNTNIEELRSPSVITVSSSDSDDTSIAITVFGIVSGYPDYEIINTNASVGTTAVTGSKIFSSVERITKNQETQGRITCTANGGNTTVSVLPVGKTTTGPLYTKVQLYPLPTAVFPINVLYYKLPYQLVNDGDVPEIGEEFSEAIILLATAKMKGEQNQEEDEDFMGFYEDEIDSLKKTNVDKIDWLPKLHRPSAATPNVWGGQGIRPDQVGGSGNYGWTSR